MGKIKMKLGIITLAALTLVGACKGSNVPDVTGRAFAKSVVLTLVYGTKSVSQACTEVVNSRIDSEDMTQVMSAVEFGVQCQALLKPVMGAIVDAAEVLDTWKSPKDENALRQAACAAVAFTTMAPKAALLLKGAGVDVPAGVSDAVAMAATISTHAIGCR